MITSQEFCQAYEFLRSMLSDLDDYTQIELTEVLDDLKVDCYDFAHSGAPEPDWLEYADSIDEVLVDGGYARLFAGFKTEVAA